MKKVLVIQNKFIGDVLIASVLAQNIKKTYPNCHVSYLVYDYCAGVIENHPQIDEVITVNERWLKRIPNLVRLAFQIRNKSFDTIFDPYSKFQSRVLCLFSSAKTRIGFYKGNFDNLIPYYTQSVKHVQKKTRDCGKSIEDRLMLLQCFPEIDMEQLDDKPKIYLCPEERNYKSEVFLKPHIVLGILGSTAVKSLPHPYIIEIVNFLTTNYDFQIIFNYSPHQKELAKAIYDQCEHKDKISLDLYENSIRGFVKIMGQSRLLIANEGGSVHIAKALDKPTFTIFSPYELKEHWASFDDGKFHASVHLLEEKPELFPKITRKVRRKIEANPSFYYNEFRPEFIIPKLKVFLEHHTDRLL